MKINTKISLLFKTISNLVFGETKKEMSETDKFIDRATIVSMTDEKGRITYVNEKFEKISGYKLDEVKLNLDVQMMELVGEMEPQTETAE